MGQFASCARALARTGWRRCVPVLLYVGMAWGQQVAEPPKSPTLEQVLDGVERNFDDYVATSPKILYAEHVTASHGTGVTMIGHAFLYPASNLSTELERCYDYGLEVGQRLHGAAVMVVDFALKKRRAPGRACPIEEPVTGRAYVDAETMQLVRAEEQFADHLISEERRGRWTLTVDYAPVKLGSKSYWLPKAMSSHAMTGAFKSFREWTFFASYSNYHLLSVHSTVLPGYEVTQ